MKKRRKAFMIAVVLTVGTLMNLGQGVGGGCWSFVTSSGLFALNPCGILDCSQGLFGGALDPCGAPNNPADDLFMGCP